MLRFLVPFSVALYVLYPAAGRATEFSWDLTAVSSEGRNGAAETDRSSLGATRYFGGVDDSLGPYSLAPFLDPASSVSVALGHSKLTQDTFQLYAPGLVGPPTARMSSREDERSVGGRYVLPHSKWYVGGDYAKSDGDTVFAPTSDNTSYGVIAGKYLGPNTSLEATVATSEARGENPFIVCDAMLAVCFNAGMVESRIRQNHTSIGLIHVAGFHALRYSLSGRIANTTGHSEAFRPGFTLPFPFPPPPFGPVTTTTVPASSFTSAIPRLRNYSVAGELFPTTRFGVRIGYTRWDDDTPANDAYDVTATWFVTRNVGLRFSFSKQRANGAGIVYTNADYQNLHVGTIGVIGRF